MSSVQDQRETLAFAMLEQAEKVCALNFAQSAQPVMEEFKGNMQALSGKVLTLEDNFNKQGQQLNNVIGKMDELMTQVQRLQVAQTAQEETAKTHQQSLERQHASAMEAFNDKVTEVHQVLDRKADCKQVDQVRQETEQALRLQSDSIRQHDDQFKKVEKKIEENCEVAVEKMCNERDETQRKLDTLQHSLTSLEQDVSEKASSAQFLQTNTDLRTFAARFENIETALPEKATGEQLQQVKSQVNSLQAQLGAAEQEIQGKAGSEQVEQNKTAVTGVQQKLINFENVLAQKAENGQLVQVREAVTTLQRSKIPTLEQGLQAGAEQVRQLENQMGNATSQIAGLEDQINDRATSAQVNQVECVLGRMQSQVANVEQSVMEKASTQQIQQIRRDFAVFETKCSDMEQSMQEKATVEGLQQIKNNQRSMEGKVSAVEQQVQEKVAQSQMQQHNTMFKNLQGQVGRLEQAMHEKVNGEQLTQFKGMLNGLQSQLNACEQLVNDKVDAGMLQQLKGNLNTLEAKFGGMEKAMEEKVSAAQAAQFAQNLASAEQKINGLRESVFEGVELVSALDNKVQDQKYKMGTLEQRLGDKVSVEEMQDHSTQMGRMSTKLSSLDQQFRARTEHQKQAEEALGAVITQMNQLKAHVQAQQGGGLASSSGSASLSREGGTSLAQPLSVVPAGGNAGLKRGPLMLDLSPPRPAQRPRELGRHNSNTNITLMEEADNA
mmetsp:Transcript_16768/g.31120  ORF Transcript_16768/g.31120 Transcript_16768/m.31120 type:complete len:722 (-) Transcript_16768:167-2332(-)